MLSSIKLSIYPLLSLLLWLLIATLLTLSAAYTLPQTVETTTIATEIDTLLPVVETTTTVKSIIIVKGNKINTTTPTQATATTATLLKSTTTKKLLLLQNTNQQKNEDYGKSVKIFFPAPSDSEEESKLDVYGWKTTPLPNGNKMISDNKPTPASTEASVVIDTTTTQLKANNATTNATIISVDDRVGLLNLAPNCPDGFVIVNQRCHKSA